MASIGFHTAVTKSGFSVASLFASVAAWNDARMTRNSLNKLSARELNDIGLVRSDIDAIAKGNLIR